MHLTLNGRYAGVYGLLERLELGSGRVSAGARGGSGGYVVELSDRPGDGPIAGPVSGGPYAFADPRASALESAEEAAIAADVGAMEQALLGGTAPWRSVLEESAAVDHLPLQELFKNHDAFSRSTYLVKPRGGRFALGPLWDMDRSMGDIWAGAGAAPEGWLTAGRPFAASLLADPGFRARLVARWTSWRVWGLERTLRTAVDEGARRLRRAIHRDARRWPRGRSGAHPAEVRRLRAWLAGRVAWMDANVTTLGT